MVWALLVAAAWSGPLEAGGVSDPPELDEARALAVELADRAGRGELTGPWLRSHVAPVALSAGADEAWYRHLEAALSSGALARTLATSEGTWVGAGPDHARVVWLTRPLLSVVVKEGAEGPVIDAIETTTCVRCSEPERFVRDLVADVQRGGGAPRLLPGVELWVEPWLEANPRAVRDRWVPMYVARNTQGHALAWWLAGAEVVSVDLDRVGIRYADGSIDTWSVVYRDGRWMVDYAQLPEQSPLKMPPAEALMWRDRRLLQQQAVARWEPDLAVGPDGYGTRVGHRAIGAMLDPRDDTVVVTVMDLDRVLAAVFRVDPATGAVVARTALPRPDLRTHIDVGTWFTRWHVERAPDARALLMATPSRLRIHDLADGARTAIPTPREVVALGWGRRPSEADLLSIATPRWVEILAYVPGLGTQPRGHLPVDAVPVHVTVGWDHLVTVLADGQVLVHDEAGRVEASWTACGGVGATDAAVHPEGSEVLVACGLGGENAAERFHLLLGGSTALPGMGSDRAGASFSPDGDLFTTPAQGGDEAGVLVWRSADDQPVARVGRGHVREVDWSADGSALLTLGADGEVWFYEVEAVMAHGLGGPG